VSGSDPPVPSGRPPTLVVSPDLARRRAWAEALEAAGRPTLASPALASCAAGARLAAAVVDVEGDDATALAALRAFAAARPAVPIVVLGPCDPVLALDAVEPSRDAVFLARRDAPSVLAGVEMATGERGTRPPGGAQRAAG
jgi:hypothetical protein